jgi:2-polyprenyl-6-methoxyphenol hydroxylase-like FAD-dependent oxidoreductase
MYVFGDDTSRFVMYPICHNAKGTEVNWVAALPAQPRYGSLQTSTPTTAKAAIIDFFSDWTIGPVTVRRLLSATQSLRSETLVDHPSLHAWFRGDVILVGDAAHHMLPMGSSGAGQAIADGITLAAAIDDHPCNEAAFTLYQRQRLNRVNKLVELNRAMGPEQILTDYHRRSNGHGRIEDSFTSTELEHYRVAYQTALDDSFHYITSEGAARAV